MKNILTAPFIQEISEMTANMYRLGWDERNGGNISWLLEDEPLEYYLDLDHVIRTIPINFDASYVAGRIFMVTGTGKYFKNITPNPAENLGIVRVAQDGKSLELLWGFEGNAAPTSEFPTHLMNHMERLKVDPTHRVIMHCHPVNTIAMTFVHSIDEKEFTKTLWGMCTECIVVFPDGAAVKLGSRNARRFRRPVVGGQKDGMRPAAERALDDFAHVGEVGSEADQRPAHGRMPEAGVVEAELDEDGVGVVAFHVPLHTAQAV